MSINKRISIPVGEYCHVYNRGVDKRDIFHNTQDLQRFLESMNIFNTQKPTGSLTEKIKVLQNHEGVGHLDDSGDKLVAIVAYSLLPNHFHFLLKQNVEGGISEFMKRLLGGYTNYFNIENQRSGSLFQGKYKYKHLDTDNYFRNIFYYATFNSQVHNHPNSLENLAVSSFDEYKNNTLKLISRNEMDFVTESLGSISKIQKDADEFISIVLKDRLDKKRENSAVLLE